MSKCPYCGSPRVAGLMSSFFVPLDEDGVPDGQWSDWESCSELESGRSCTDCGEEWDEDGREAAQEWTELLHKQFPQLSHWRMPAVGGPFQRSDGLSFHADLGRQLTPQLERFDREHPLGES